MAQLPETLTLEVATPLGLALRTDAKSVVAPSVNGEFGVLPGHLPLLAALQPGLLRYRADGQEHIAAIGAGFVEAGPDKVLLLTEQYTTAETVDVQSAKADLQSAQERLRAHPGECAGAEYEALLEQLAWAEARLAAARLTTAH